MQPPTLFRSDLQAPTVHGHDALVIRASELPAPLVYAFVDALDAWGQLERELFMTWQFLRRAPDFDAAWEEFSRLSTSEQRKSTIKPVDKYLGTKGKGRRPTDVFERLVELTKMRDRIVHGRWQKVEDEDGQELDPEYVRLYDARGEPARPRNTDEEKQMLGRSRFYEPELREAQRQFLDAARSLHFSRAELIVSRR